MSKLEFGKMKFRLNGRAARFAVAAAFGFVAIAGLGTSPASARIKCQNGYQIIDGSPHATPYCQDQLLARVAREYGTKVSARSIRNNPNLKRHVCRLVGRDIRVQENCITVTPNLRGRF